MLAFALWYEALVAAVLIAALGRLALKDTGLLTLVAMIALPISAIAVRELELTDRPAEVIAMCAFISVILIAKRLTANWERPTNGQPVLHTLICRILWDRDVHKRQNWTERTPTADISEASEQ